MIPGFGAIDWTIGDMAAVASGVPFKLNDTTSGNFFSVTTPSSGGNPCRNSNEVSRDPTPAPRAGSVKLTFEQVSSGQPLTMDIEGPLLCATWTEVTAHVTAVWQ
jgi:hypothetical protein